MVGAHVDAVLMVTSVSVPLLTNAAAVFAAVVEAVTAAAVAMAVSTPTAAKTPVVDVNPPAAAQAWAASSRYYLAVRAPRFASQSDVTAS